MDFDVNIGLETHVQLKTKSKMWCGCPNQFGSEPNTNVCPVCLGMPGVLPVANAEALRLTVLTGFLLNSQIPRHAVFDRKNYFYPDVAKNYQVTQLAFPSTLGGHVDFEFEGEIKRVRITRAHLEEDVGKNNHFDRHSGVDFNRAGVPLLEIVSEPDITSADMAYEYLNALKEILVHGGVSDADMEKGMVRCDVNVSVRPEGQAKLGAKIEIKNMNSFNGVRRALQYEIPRQIEAVSKGEKLRQETRRWDDVSGMTEVMRSKEHAHDYRYFPEPDLMPFEPTDEWLAEVRTRVVELPLARKKRFISEYSLAADQAETFKQDVKAGEYFEQCAKELIGKNYAPEKSKRALQALANTVIQQYRPRLQESGNSWVDLSISTTGTNAVSESFAFGEINSSGYQEVVTIMFSSRRSDVARIIDERKLKQVSDIGAIEKLCDEAIAANPGPAADFRAGKVAALNRIKGHVMKLSQGKANPALVGEILERKLKS